MEQTSFVNIIAPEQIKSRSSIGIEHHRSLIKLHRHGEWKRSTLALVIASSNERNVPFYIRQRRVRRSEESCNEQLTTAVGSVYRALISIRDDIIHNAAVLPHVLSHWR